MNKLILSTYVLFTIANGVLTFMVYQDLGFANAFGRAFPAQMMVILFTAVWLSRGESREFSRHNK